MMKRSNADGWWRAAATVMLAATLAVSAHADESPDDCDHSFKLTAGHYASSDDNPGTDVNLRYEKDVNTAWVGEYRDRSGFRQARAGYERHVGNDALDTVFSIQSASGGAVVGSVTSTIGDGTYAIVGFGRTNVRNYVNLNYDPNDAITLGAGARLGATELSLVNIHDDRLHTGQNVTHAVLKERFANCQRMTVDVFVKRGLTGDGVMVRNARSISVDYKRGAWFVRYAYDPYAGFASPTQHRLSLALYF